MATSCALRPVSRAVASPTVGVVLNEAEKLTDSDELSNNEKQALRDKKKAKLAAANGKKQADYDTATNHGKDKKKQAAWDASHK